MQTGKHSLLVQMRVKQLSEIPELRAHKQPDRVAVRRLSVYPAKEIHGLTGFICHQLLEHFLHRAAVAAAEKQRTFIIILSKKFYINTLLKIYRFKQRLRCAGAPRFLVFQNGRGKYFP